ncbi:MAG: hypothetical protein EBW87_02040 [Burkholderiaceae bacterium]|nr:hypothetical protein [Burkholderiaceae bacterium]
MIRKSTSKTFYKGESEYTEVLDFLEKNIEATEVIPEGTVWIGGEPGPCDPRCELKFKYIITITKIEE